MANFLIAFPGFVIMFVITLAIAFRWFTVPGDRKRTEWLLVPALMIQPMAVAAQLIANAMSPLRPIKYDLYVYQFDAFFGSPGFRLGQLTWSHLWLHNLVSISYGMLPVAMYAGYAINLLFASEAQALKVMRIFATLFFVGAVAYLIIPVSGPIYAFPNFPAMPSPFTAHPLALAAPPNAVPSGHMTTALFLAYFLWKWRWGKVTGILFVALTALATLGCGQHYLFDLVISVPYVAGILWIEGKLFNRVQTLDNNLGGITWQRSQQ